MSSLFTPALTREAPSQAQRAVVVARSDAPVVPPRDAIDRSRLLLAGEILVVALWAIFVARGYLNLDPNFTPTGREFLSAIQTHHFWTRVVECGTCALWNGSVRGGYPALSETYGSLLHPIVLYATLVFGVLNGVKVALVGSFVMAGLAQWWFAYTAGVGRIARVWCAATAVVGGHLAARMDHGVFGLVLSMAACTLLFPVLINFARAGSTWRWTVALGATFALAILAGQAYFQLGFLLLLPALLLLLPMRREVLARTGRRLLVALGLAALLVGPLAIPVLHLLPQFWKDGDAAFQSAQPLGFIPLNLVINDVRFDQLEVMGKAVNPTLYGTFIGWIPVLLAVVALWKRGPFRERALVHYLVALVLLAWLLASALPFRLITETLAGTWIAGFLAGIRFTSLFAALAVPPILVLAALGLDHLLKAPFVQSLRGAVRVGVGKHILAVNLSWLLAIPLLFGIREAWDHNGRWLNTAPINQDVAPMIQALRTDDLQWVTTPMGEQFWLEPAIAAGLKLQHGSQSWHWADRARPEPVVAAVRSDTPPEGMSRVAQVGSVPIYRAAAGREYAAVSHADGSRTVCRAYGQAGTFDVGCNLAQPGRLQVKENAWSGWQAHLDGNTALPLSGDGQWLSVEMPAGEHTIQFRYRPWDVPLGLALMLSGLALAVYLWQRREAPTPVLSWSD